MLREADIHHRYNEPAEPVWPVLNRKPLAAEPIPAVVEEALLFRSAEATPDVPASLGFILFGSYMALIAALAVATAGPGESHFVLTISALFVVAFFTVPRFIFAVEPQTDRRPTLAQFLANGMRTCTGHCSGGSAMLQMLIVPVLLTLGMLLIALEISFIG